MGAYRKKISAHPKCQNYIYNSNCTGGCGGIAYGSTGDVFHPDIYCDQLITYGGDYVIKCQSF